MLEKIINKQRSWAVDGWAVFQNQHDLSEDAQTIFSQGNGFFGIRGIDEERLPMEVRQSGAFVQGLYEIQQDHKILCMKGAPILPDVFYRAAPAPHFLHVQIKVGDAVFSPDHCSAYTKKLNLKDGVLQRDAQWDLPDGKRIRVQFSRVVSLLDRQLFASQIRITPLNFSGRVELISTLDARSNSTVFGTELWSGATTDGSPDGLRLSANTRYSNLSVDLFCRHRLSSGAFETFAEEHRIGQTVAVDAVEGLAIVFEKIVWLDTRQAGSPISEIGRAASMLDKTYEQVASESALEWEQFWLDSDVEIDGDSEIQQGVRFSISQLRQAYRSGPAYGLGAKGLTSELYGLAHFWDSEAYMLPFYLYTSPEMARQILMFRYDHIDQARARAQRWHQKGAAFELMTVQGEDNPSAWACILGELFVNTTLPYAICEYVSIADDEPWLVSHGAEMLIECARFWAGRVSMDETSGTYFINQVTGPDEYSEWVNNNFFTNVMAAWTLSYASEVVALLRARYSSEWVALTERLGFVADEELAWDDISEKMYTGYNEQLGVHEEHTGFFGLDKVNLEVIPAEEFPFEENWPWPKVLQHNALKQPDVLMAEMMLGGQFSTEQKKADYDYYEPLTTHDSSLSPSIHSILAAELGMADKAYSYLRNCCRLDLDYGDASAGIHLANAAGAWMSMVHGLAGYRQDRGCVSFDPTIFSGWKAYSFRLKLFGSTILVKVTPGGATLSLLDGEAVRVTVCGKESELKDCLQVPVRILERSASSAVLFDLDGVVVSTDECHYKAWKQLADEEGISFDRTVNDRLRGVSREASLEILLEKASRSYSADEKREMASRKNGYYLKLLETITPKDVLPGVQDLIADLKNEGVKVAIASSSKNAPVILERIGMSDVFHAVADGNDISASKPDPEVFLVAAARVGVLPKNCLVVEDAHAGVEAAHAAGMRCLAVGGAAGHPQADASRSDLRGMTSARLAAV